ncbi:MAG: molecular chaperone, partial [Thalassolituus sp.]
MICGFDYGTSNCAMGIFENNAVRLLNVDGDKQFMPSALYALGRELICEQVSHGIKAGTSRDEFIALRRGQLQMALRVRNELDLIADDNVMFVGHEAFK